MRWRALACRCGHLGGLPRGEQVHGGWRAAAVAPGGVQGGAALGCGGRALAQLQARQQGFPAHGAQNRAWEEEGPCQEKTRATYVCARAYCFEAMHKREAVKAHWAHSTAAMECLWASGMHD